MPLGSCPAFGATFPIPGVVDGLYCLHQGFPNLPSPRGLPGGSDPRYTPFCTFLVNREALTVTEETPSLVVWIDFGSDGDDDTVESGPRFSFDEDSVDKESLWWDGQGGWFIGFLTFVKSFFSLCSS
jgi:hypothetical protein